MRAAARPTVLGLCSFTHDSAAALIVDGQLIGLVEEERLSGTKHTRAYPQYAVAALLRDAGIGPADIDLVAYNFAGRRYLSAVPDSLRHLGGAGRDRAVARAVSFADVYLRYRRRMRWLHHRFPRARLRGVLHHRAHGLYAFAASGFDRAAVLIVDSLGETQTTTLADVRTTGAGVAYRAIDALHDPVSLGYAYGAVTEHLGWRRGDEEGTVMALAALGDPRRFRGVFAEAIALTPGGFALHPGLFALRVLRHGWSRVTPDFAAATCPPRGATAEVTQVHADLAAALQERTEEAMLHLARRARERTGARLLCVGGGVAANCVAVGKIVDAELFDQVSVPPAPGDAGTAAGAALAAHLDATGHRAAGVSHRCYLGPACRTGRPPPASGQTVRRVADPSSAVAESLAAGHLVGVFRGRMEAGPRALGNRSILASPLVSGVVNRLNATVKFREPFRPFAPVVLTRAAPEYFRIRQASPYMSIAVEATTLARERIPAIVHANGTARVQTVDHSQNPFLAEVLERFADRTGVPVLINTSLNVKGRPISGTLDAALECLRSTGLDALMVNDRWWVTK